MHTCTDVHSCLYTSIYAHTDKRDCTHTERERQRQKERETGRHTKREMRDRQTEKGKQKLIQPIGKKI